MVSNATRILIAESDGNAALRLKRFLENHGFDVQLAKTGSDLKAHLTSFSPRWILIDLVFPQQSAFELLTQLKSSRRPRSQQPDVVILSAHNEESNIRRALAAGAKDWLVKPVQPEALLKRLLFYSRSVRERRSIPGADDLLQFAHLMVREGLRDERLTLRLQNLTRILNATVHGARCSVIQVLTRFEGVVVASNDEQSATGLLLDLMQYPEVSRVMEAQRLLAFEDLNAEDELRQILARVQDIEFSALVAAPISRHNLPFGILSVRLTPERTQLTDNELALVEMGADIASLILSSEPLSQKRDEWMTDLRPANPQLIAFRKK